MSAPTDGRSTDVQHTSVVFPTIGTILSVMLSLFSGRCRTHEAILCSMSFVMYGIAESGIFFAIWHAFCYLVSIRAQSHLPLGGTAWSVTPRGHYYGNHPD